MHESGHDLAEQRQAILRQAAEAGLSRDDLVGAEFRWQPFADNLEAIDLARLRHHGGWVKRKRLESRAEAALRSTKGQKALPKSGLFSTVGFAKPRGCSAN